MDNFQNNNLNESHEGAPNYIDNDLLNNYFPRPQYEQSLAKELNPYRDYIHILKLLKGKITDEKNEMILFEFDPILTTQGFSAFVHNTAGVVTSITTYSNFQNQNNFIMSLVREDLKNIIIQFTFHAQEYFTKDIDVDTGVNLITNISANLLISTYFKALGAGDRKAISKAVSENITRVIGDPQKKEKKGGFFTR